MLLLDWSDRQTDCSNAYCPPYVWETQESQTIYFEVGENGADVLLEAHVDHAVGLIETEVAADLEVQHLLVQHVHETAGRRRYHVHAPVTITMETYYYGR